MNLEIRPTSDYTTHDLLKLLNLSFEEYVVPIHFELTQFLTMLRKDNVDLDASRVLLIDGESSGLALIARRGWSSRLAAMGLVKEARGKRAGSWFMGHLVREAGDRSDRRLTLEVIEGNEAGVRLYKRHGFQIVRRLVSFVHQDAKQAAKIGLQELDLREMGQLVSQFGLPDLPWQLSGETIASLTPPARAYKTNDGAYIAVSNPEAEHVVIWSLLVEPEVRGNDLALGLLADVLANHPGRTWHVPAILPEELGFVFERAGFRREELSQFQMELNIS